ncbi:RHS repeat-associated core domain-containing protein [Pseudodesulfovibrio indicus]|uniref:RHS repeat-associated core domain-containing protein n=1 Tax=Pseudodesulfovibrio indicus TaxID=1716143 RepID=UPI000AF6410A|nr:RHS repeat-associated core domain-containing protein [Pseudodesulfovibrio indicus]
MRDYLPATAGANYREYQYTQDNRQMRAGSGQYSHDERGFRSIWSARGVYTLYEYAPDYRLLKAEEEDRDKAFTFRHDEDGQRVAKYLNGELAEAYQWLDFVRLAGFHDGQHGYEFAYRDGERTPFALRRDDGTVAGLFYDQVSSLRLVVDMHDNVIKEIVYDPFGGIIEDTNPGFRIPLGFAGGLHDRDLGFVRFGWRDYDVKTGRWTAPDPIGEKGGDPDWYGYCLDDPVNGVDPAGLLPFLLPFAAGMAGATAISATGSYLAAKATDWLGKKTDKDYGKDKPTATVGVHDAMGKVIGINSGIVSAAGATKAAPAVLKAAPTLIRQGKNVAKELVKRGKRGVETGRDFVDETINDVAQNPAQAATDAVSSALPTGTPTPTRPGYIGAAASKLIDQLYNRKK